MRSDGRSSSEFRPMNFNCGFTTNPMGSVLVSCGKTMVLCTASVEERVPPFLKNLETPQGWITAEYSLLPGSPDQRFKRERGSKHVGGRTYEIQRLIGRSLRAAIDLTKLGSRTITLDCDVLQADGGTRTTSINGAFAALQIAVDRLMKKGLVKENPIVGQVRAIFRSSRNRRA